MGCHVPRIGVLSIDGAPTVLLTGFIYIWMHNWGALGDVLKGTDPRLDAARTKRMQRNGRTSAVLAQHGARVTATWMVTVDRWYVWSKETPLSNRESAREH